MPEAPPVTTAKRSSRSPAIFSLSITLWTVAAAARDRSIGNRGAVSGDGADEQFI
jgi:hypothetical protein